MLVGNFTTATATYTLENATEATATLTGDNVFIIKKQSTGEVQIVFMPEEEGTYTGTLTITSGSISENIDFSASAIIKTTAVDEVTMPCIYTKDGTIYCDEEFAVYNLAGINVTHLNGYLQGIYIVKTSQVSQLVSVR